MREVHEEHKCTWLFDQQTAVVLHIINTHNIATQTSYKEITKKIISLSDLYFSEKIKRSMRLFKRPILVAQLKKTKKKNKETHWYEPKPKKLVVDDWSSEQNIIVWTFGHIENTSPLVLYWTVWHNRNELNNLI